ncbi:MAG TPA: carbohydrate ABC transporter permease [Acidimicrobiales bacterium]|jgi:ABC-type glycerol-3-phosphate transport system permease component|nr:carbohydrate ABC transporter permease [Acidimicrobiales bacterium]
MTLVLLPGPHPDPKLPEPPQVTSAPLAPSKAEILQEITADVGPRRWAGTIIGHAVLVVLCIVCVLPMVWMYLGSARPPAELFSAGLFSGDFSRANYDTAVQQMPVATLFANTAIMSVCVAIGQLITGLLAAYGLSRWRFFGRNVIFLIFVGTWLVPFQVTMLPNYVLLSQWGLLNTLPGVIIPQLASAFAIILLRQHLNGFPTELLDASAADGQSSWSTLWTVVVPNLVPALAALGILLLVTSWNEYFWPLLVFRNQNSSVLQLGIQTFLSETSTNYGALMAASGLACLPVFVLYIILQRRVVNAFVRSGLR